MTPYHSDNASPQMAVANANKGRPLASMVDRYLAVWLSLLCLLAYFWPHWFGWAADVFIGSQPAIPYLIALIMFVVGTLLPRDEIEQIGRHWHTVFAGTAVQYTSMPLLAFVGTTLFVNDMGTYIGVILVGCVPGAMASNVLTLKARGNVSYSVSLTTLATMLSPLVVPFALFLALGAHVQLNTLDIFFNLLLTVVVPVFAGFTLCRYWQSFAVWMRHSGPFIANAVILWLIAVVVGINRNDLGNASVGMMLLLLAINIAGYGAGYLAGMGMRFSESMRRALTIEIGMQNAGLGTALALQFFREYPEAAIPPALYTFGCMFTGTLLASWWQRRTPEN